jgi:uncharacterized surface protein with fasciclin (FAS1) repeats
LITGPLLNNSNYGFIGALNTTSTDTPLTVFAPVNAAFARFRADTGSYDLLRSTYPSPSDGNVTLRETVIANHVIAGSALNSTLIVNALASTNHSRKLIYNLIYGTTKLETLAGLNITVQGLVQNGTGLPVPPLIFVQNALVIKPNAIVAANGVVHLISNLIDPFAEGIGGFYGPGKEVVEGVETTFGPLLSLAMSALNI